MKFITLIDFLRLDTLDLKLNRRRMANHAITQNITYIMNIEDFKFSIIFI